jgi:ParB family chromosome partitioning protein
MSQEIKNSTNGGSMGQKPVLGKGLASLFPKMSGTETLTVNTSTNPATVTPAAASMGTGAVAAGPAVMVQPEMSNKDRIPGITMAPVGDIIVNPHQPRRDFDEKTLEELAASIRANGIIQPLVVRRNTTGSYELIAGERRLRASKLAGLQHVPVVVRRSTDRESLEIALVENIQRQNLNCVDEALAYFQLMEDFSLTQEEVSTRVGKDRATIANYLRLLRLPQEIIADLKSLALSFGHGKALLSIEEPELRLRARTQIIEKHLSVRDTEALVEEIKRAAQESKDGAGKPTGEKITELTPMKSRLMNLAQELTRQWSTRVEMKGSERRGKIVVHYASRQELDRLIEAMQNRS